MAVLEKGRSVGGRLATRRIGDATLDHGAQFFTVRSDAFRAEVDAWLAAGVVHEWCQGFGEEGDGHPRYAAGGGLNQVAKHLARDLADVHTGVVVQAVTPSEAGWRLAAVAGDMTARAVVITSPVPQSLALLDAGGTPLEPEVDDGLRAIRYEPTLALLLALDRPPAVPAPGARKPEGGRFDIVVDNVAKGASSAPAVTLHLRAGESAQRYDEPDEAVLAQLLPAAQAWLGAAQVFEAQVKRWRYATPVTTWPETSCVAARGPSGPVVLGGDAFAGPRVEGAWLSGSAAADSLLV